MTTSTDTAIILGGSSGMGLAAAAQLNARGVSVVLVSKTEEKLIAAQESLCSKKASVQIWVADLACTKSWPNLIEKIDALAQSTRIRYLVNSAGYFKPKPFLEHTQEDYHVS